MTHQENQLIEQHVPLMAELNDEMLEELMGGGPPGSGGWLSVTCECSCMTCTAWVYGCTW